jgi:hypothetical protein
MKLNRLKVIFKEHFIYFFIFFLFFLFESLVRMNKMVRREGSFHFFLNIPLKI